MLLDWHGDTGGDADRADDGRAEHAGGLGARKAERRLVERARIVLLAADGWGSRAIAREVGWARGVVSKWRLRFAKDRLAGLTDAPRSGKPKTCDADLLKSTEG